MLDPAGLQWWLNTWDGDLIVELAELSITVGGDVAFRPDLSVSEVVRAGKHAENLPCAQVAELAQRLEQQDTHLLIAPKYLEIS